MGRHGSDNYYYGSPPGRRDTLAKKRRTLFALRLLVIMLSLTVVGLTTALAASRFSWGSQDGRPTTIITESTLPIEITETTEPPPTPTPRPELWQSQPIVEQYFGPLPVPSHYIEPDREVVRGLYVGAAGNLDANFALANQSDINAFVVDLKESNGILFNSKNELAHELGQVRSVYSLETFVNRCHENDIYVIARIVCFKDPGYAEAFPDRSIKDANGNLLHFSIEGNMAFASPYDTRNWDYYIDLALEAVEAGVDEIQFDYVRFPTGRTTTGERPYFGEEGEVPERYEAINRFLQTARIRIQDEHGVPVSADVFGAILTSRPDGYILGQDWETIGLTGIDNLCPMIYPSHYALGTVINGRQFDKPDFYPYDIVYQALMAGKQKTSVEGYSVVRPYLQAFTASYIGQGNYMTYTYKEANDQVRAVYDAGYSEWILWNAAARYQEGSYTGHT